MIRELCDVPDDVALGTELVREYMLATAEEIDQDVATILPFIPDVHDFGGRYFRGGTFFVAEVDGLVAGCVGVTPLDSSACEMNRLWVRPPFRQRGLARQLSIASITAARRLGFARMILDVLISRPGAIALYESLGFIETDPTHDYPFPMKFLERDL
jgi:ribosomal protein S18 acetylase RimI-like enzyme